jgi:hypothetical protein
VDDVVTLWKKIQVDKTEKIPRDQWSLRIELVSMRLDDYEVAVHAAKIQRTVNDFN